MGALTLILVGAGLYYWRWRRASSHALNRVNILDSPLPSPNLRAEPQSSEYDNTHETDFHTLEEIPDWATSRKSPKSLQMQNAALHVIYDSDTDASYAPYVYTVPRNLLI